MPFAAQQRMHFGPFELNAHAGELYKCGLKLKLQGHPIQILAMLLERPGELITREEIQQKLWPRESETFVDFEHGLNTAVRKLRQALGDEAETPQYIETLPRRGYRFVGAIAAEDVAQTNGTGSPKSAIDSQTVLPGKAWLRKPKSSRSLWIAMAAVVLLGFAAWSLRVELRRPETLRITDTQQLTFNGTVGYFSPTVENYRSIQTDGRRIYYSVLGDHPLRSISIRGGEEATLPLPFSDVEAAILHISPDGSTLIVRQVLGAAGGNEAPLWLVATNGDAARRLGDIEAQDAAFAPDGKTIAFAKGRELFLTDLQGTTPAKLADTPGHAFWLRWSRDGRVLRFSVLAGDDFQFTLWELGSDRRLHQLLKNWTQGTHVCCGLWSADANYYLFSSDNQYWYIREPITSDSQPSLLTTGGLRLTAATPNPLSNEIFVSAYTPSNTVFEWEPKADRLSAIYPDLQAIRIYFAPDGKHLAYVKRSSTGTELWQAETDGRNRRQLTANPLSPGSLMNFSPDSQKIAFVARKPDQPWRIYWGPAQGGKWQEIPAPPDNQSDPNWSPDGASILFGELPEYMTVPGIKQHLYLYNLGSQRTDTLPDSSGLFSPRRSPDSHYIAAMAADYQSMSILDVASGGWSPLVSHPNIDNPFWSPDSKWVYFNESERNLNVWRVRISDGRKERVFLRPTPPNYTSCWGYGFSPSAGMLLTCSDMRRNIFALELK